MIYDENLLNEEQQKIEACYSRLGERYYAAHKDDDTHEFPDLVGQIKASEKKMADHKAEVLRANGLMLCPGCGEQIYYKSLFCNFCGIRVAEKPAEEPVADEPAVEKQEIEEPAAEEPEVEVPVAPPLEAPQHFDFAPTPDNYKAMRICKNCGAQMDESCTFCVECGTIFPSDEEEIPSHKESEEPVKVEAPEADSKPVEPAAAPAPAGPRFCMECGYKVLDPDAMFCRSCGAKLESADAPDQTPALAVSQDEAVVKRCPRCGFNTTDKDVMFCIECGMRLI